MRQIQEKRQALPHTSDGPPAALPLPSAVDAPGNWAACGSRTCQGEHRTHALRIHTRHVQIRKLLVC